LGLDRPHSIKIPKYRYLLPAITLKSAAPQQSSTAAILTGWRQRYENTILRQRSEFTVDLGSIPKRPNKLLTFFLFPFFALLLERELASRDAKPDSQPKSPQLVPVRVVDSKAKHADAVPSDSAVIEIGIPGGITLRAGVATDTERVGAWIAAIIKVVTS